MKTSAARRPEAFLNNCHGYSNVATEFFVTFRFGLTVHQSDGASKHTFLPNSQEDGIVQLPFMPALRLRLLSNGPRTVLPLEPFLQSSPFSVPLKPETSWLYNSPNNTPYGRALEFQSMVSPGCLRYEPFWLKIGCGLHHHFLLRTFRSYVLACTGKFPVSETSPWIEHSWRRWWRRRMQTI